MEYWPLQKFCLIAERRVCESKAVDVDARLRAEGGQEQVPSLDITPAW